MLKSRMPSPVPLHTALSELASIPQFFVWYLADRDATGKYRTKWPWANGGKVDAQLPTNWHTYEAASAALEQLRTSAPPGVTYTLGFMFTEGCGYWFLDLDKCIGADGQYTPLALDWLAKLPGCFFEFSSSGIGTHSIGKGQLPPHSTKNTRLNAELYTDKRGIAFGLSGEAYGCADVPAPAILEIAAEYFPARAIGVADDSAQWLKPRADWAGPADDAELLRRMLGSASVAAKLGHRATFAQLWSNSPELEGFYGPDTHSERDAALAAHLSFWTGCDAPRMERLMRASGLVRPKWDEHRTYLRELTIDGACARQGEVLHDRPRAALPTLPPLLPLANGATSEPRYKLLNGGQLRNLPSPTWRVRGVLPPVGLAALYGPSASGKSFLAFDMAAAIAEGERWFDCRVEAVPVVYAALEGEAGFKLRAQAWETSRGRPLPAKLYMMMQPFKLTTPQDVADLAAVVPAGAVVVVDTLNRAAPTADENSSKDMGEILEAAKALQTQTGGLVLLVHHTGKDSARGLRGHSSLFAAMDAAIEVSRDGERREWKVAKSKDGQDGTAHPFRLHIETLGKDDMGEVVSSCVVKRDTTPTGPRTAQPQGGNQKLVWEAIRPLFESGQTDMPGVPPMRLSIELEAAVNSGAPKLTCDPSRRNERARAAITAMISGGFLGCNDGRLWRA